MSNRELLRFDIRRICRMLERGHLGDQKIHAKAAVMLRRALKADAERKKAGRKRKKS